jgi:FMN phosphatase YigB (HAD superfamily)
MPQAMPTTLPIDAVLLDLGNVLVFHDNDYLLARLAALGPRSVAEVAAALAPLWDPCNTGRLAGGALRNAIASAAGVPLDDDAFAAVWSCHFTVHEQVLPLVESLAGRVKLLLVSNTNAAHIEALRPRLPVLERFDSLVLSHEIGIAKPDPGIFAEALRRAGTAPDRTVFFDDVPAYVEAARAAGLRAEVFTDAPTFRTHLAALGL